MRTHTRLGLVSCVCSMLSLCLVATAPAQCPPPATYAIGGQPGPVCPATIGYQAVARGRFVSIERTPLTGFPAAVSRIGLDHPALHMHTEILGRVWATDGQTVYGLDTNTVASPSILGRFAPSEPGGNYFQRLRIRGNYVYVVGGYSFLILDVTNPAAPVLRSTFTPADAFINDVEVVGSYAYLAIRDMQATAGSIMVVDISNPQQPVEIRRVGNSAREGLRLATRSGLLYALSRNAASGALELWSLANASNPSIQVLNATLSPNTNTSDDIRITSYALCYLRFQTASISLYSPANLALINTPVTLPAYTIRGFGSDSPYIYFTRSTGELGRMNIATPTSPVVNLSYFSVSPGYTFKVAANGEGFSVLASAEAFWVYRTLSGVQPSLIGRVDPDVGYQFLPGQTVLTGGLILILETTGGPSPITRLLAFEVAIITPPSVEWVGTYEVSGSIAAFDAAYDTTNTRRVYYTSGSIATGFTLHILNATNTFVMTHDGSIALTSGVFNPVKFIGAWPLSGAPARVLVGGPFGATQIVSVALPSSPSSLGVIPSGAAAITGGIIPTVWFVDGGRLKGFDISTPAAPVLQSSIRIVPEYHGQSIGGGTDVRVISPIPALLAITTSTGDLVKVLTINPIAPSILQIARIASGSSFVPNSLAYDGVNIHVAGGLDGYEVFPANFSAPPREDPNLQLDRHAVQGIVPICTGVPVVLDAHFVADPAVSSYQWFRWDPPTNTSTPLVDGPTGTGSIISGATTATLTISNAGGADMANYYCRATNSCGSGITPFTVEARPGGYANCDRSTGSPALNVADFVCFLQRFAASFFYADCNDSGNLDVDDFVCFQQQFAAGCP